MPARERKSLRVASISVVVLDARTPLAIGDMGFTEWRRRPGNRLTSSTREWGKAKEIAWVEVVPLARKLNKKALRYLDCWAALTEETRGEDERAE